MDLCLRCLYCYFPVLVREGSVRVCGRCMILIFGCELSFHATPPFAQIRVSSTADAAIKHTSLYFSVAKAQSLLITYPAAGTSVQIGTAVQVTWSYTGSIPTLTLYVYKGSTLLASFPSIACSDQQYTYTVQSNSVPGRYCSLFCFVLLCCV